MIERVADADPAGEVEREVEHDVRRRLDEIVVSATRTPQTRFDVPFAVGTLSSRDLSEALIRTMPESLRDMPGIMVQKTAHGQGSPYIRGFTGYRNLLLIDGIRLNNSVFRDGPNQYWNTVDPYSLDRIEVVKGPSSVLYGAGAIGGTVLAYTLDPYSYGTGTNVNGRGLVRYASAERSVIGRAEMSLGVDETFGFVAGFTTKHFGDLKAGSPTGRQPNTGYDEYDADLKSELFLGDSSRLVFAYQRVRQNDVPRTHRTVFAKSFQGTTTGSDFRRDLDQQRDLVYGKYIAENLGGPVESVVVSLSWQVQHEDRDRIRGNGSRDFQGFDVGTLGVTTQLESPTPFGRLTYGFEYYHDNVNSFSSTNPIQGPVANDASYDSLGVYLQDEIDLHERVLLVLGGRFSYARADAGSVQDPLSGGRISLRDDWSAVVGSARLTFKAVPEHLNLYGGVSQGFRAPNLSDLTRLDSARTNEIEVPVPGGLDPEYYTTVEVGLKGRGESWAAVLSTYYTRINGAIVRTPTGDTIGSENVVTKQNVGDGYVAGIEFDASVRFHPDWTVYGNIAWLDGKQETFPTAAAIKVREPIDRLAPLMGQVGVRYDDPNRRFWVDGFVRAADRADRLSTRDQADTSRIPPGGTPGWVVLTLRGGWKISPTTTLTIAVENLTDEDYRIHGSGVNEPGRNVVLGFEARF